MIDNREAARWRRIVDALRAEAARLGDPRARARKLVEIGDTLFDRLGDAYGAVESWLAAIDTLPSEPHDALGRLERLARTSKDGKLYQAWVSGLRRAGMWAEVIDLMGRRAEALRDPRKRCKLRLEAARLCAEKLGDVAGARRLLIAAAEDADPSVLERVRRPLSAHLRETPHDEEAATTLARLLARCERPDDAIELLVETAAYLRDLPRKAALLYEAAFLCERAGRLERAPALLRDTLVYDPRREAEVIARLEALGQARPDPLTADALLDALIEAWDGLERPRRSQNLLAERIAAASGRTATDLRLRQARHAEEVMADAPRAFALYQGVAATARDPGPAIEGLRRTAMGRPGAFETIADICTRRGRQAELAALCTDEAALRGDDDERAALLHRAGTIYEELGDLDRAMARFVDAFKLRPRELKYLSAGKRLYRRQGDWAMVDRLLGLELQMLDDEAAKRTLLVEIATLRWQRLGDALGAYDALRDALRRLGDATAEDGAFDMLERLVRDPVGFEAIAGGLRTRAETEDAGARRLVELAGLHLDLRDERTIGLGLLHEAVDRAPTDGELFADVATRIGHHAGPEAEAELQRSALSRPLSIADRITALRRAGQLLGSSSPSDALAVWRALSILDPTDAEALDAAIAAAASLGPSAAATVVELLEPAIAGTRGPIPTPDRLVEWQRALARAQGRRVAPDAEQAAWLGLLDHVADDPEALAAVVPGLRAEGAFEALCDRLAAAVEAAEANGVLAIEHRITLADLWADERGDPGEAARWLIPLARAARADLRPRVFALLHAAGDRRTAIDLARRIARALTDDPAALPASIAAAAERLVALAEPEGDEPALTIGWLALSAARPDDPHPALRLAELARRTGDEDALLTALDRLGQQTPGPRGTPLRREKARLLTARKSDPPEAIVAWQAVLDDAERDTEALAALQQLHARAGDERTVYRLLWQRQAATADVDDRVALLREAAVVAEFRLGEPGEAMRAWRAVLELDGENPDALDELIRLAEDEGEFRAMLGAARIRVQQLGDADRADLARRMAEICDGPLGDEAGAVGWWRLVIEADPADAEALEALAEDAERLGETDRALSLWSRLIRAGRGGLREKALRRRAALLTAAGAHGDAMRAWRALAEARPDDPAPWGALQRVAEAIDDLPVVAEALTEQIRRLTGIERAAAQRDRARLLDGELDDAPGAIAAWEALLEEAPHDAEALGALEHLYGAAGRPLEMLRALDMLVAVTEPAAPAIGRLAAAGERMEEAGDPTTAFECWRRVHHLRTDVDRESLDALQRLAGPAGRWNACAEALAVSAGRSDGVDEQRELMLDAAAIWADRLGDRRRAFGQMQAACALDPTRPEPLARLEVLAEALGDDGAWAALAEVMIQAAEAAPSRRAALLSRAAAMHEQHRRREDVAFALLARAFEGPDCVGEIGQTVEAALVRLARRGNRWGAVIELFDTRARQIESPAEQAALLHRLGAVLERDAGRSEAAFEQYLLALQLDPIHEGIRASAHRLAHTLDMWSVVERVMRLALENAEGPRPRAAVLRAIAELQAGPLRASAESFKTLKRAFALDPANAVTRAALEHSAAAQGAAAELASFYEDEAGWAESGADRIALYRAAIDAYKATGRQVEAARVLRKLDRLAPGDAELADERLALLRQAEDPRPLAEALGNQIARSEGSRRLSLLREQAAVYAERLGDTAAAEAAWREVLDARPHDGPAFAALTESLTRRAAWAELDRALAGRIERTTAASRRGLMRRRAELLHRRLGRPVEAFDLLADVSRAEPTDLDLLDTLAQRAPIADAWPALVACAERAVAVAPRARVADVLMLIGRTARDRLGDPRKALSALSRALESRPDDLPLAREVADLLRQRRQYGPLVELHRRLGLELVARPGEHRAVVHARWALGLAELLADRLYRVDEAVAVIRGLVAEQSLNIDALRRLRTLCARAQDGAGLLDAAERLAGLATGVERLSTLVDGARALTGMGEAERAVGLWRVVLAEAPGHPEAQRAVARQAARQEDWALMIEQLEARIRAAHGPDERADLLCELGVLHQHRRADPEAAAAAYARALTVAPHHVDALLGHVELTRRDADDRALAGLAETLAGHIDRRPQTAETLLPLLVEIQLDRVAGLTEAGDEDRPLEILEPLHQQVPDDDRIGQALADALYRAGELRRAAALYLELPMPAADPTDEGEGRARQHLRRARALRAAGQDEPAMRHFDAATGHPATRACAIEQLANLQERAGRWEAAARLREKLAESVDDPQARRAAWVAAGLILEHRLGRAVRAMQAYDQAVDAGLGEPMLLGGILRLYREQARPDRVLQVSERLLAGDAAPGRRAVLWCDRAWALDTLGEAAGAREARRTALGFDPASAEAAERLFDELERAGDVEQAETLDIARDALAALTGDDRVPLLVALRDWTGSRLSLLASRPPDGIPPDGIPDDGIVIGDGISSDGIVIGDGIPVDDMSDPEDASDGSGDDVSLDDAPTAEAEAEMLAVHAEALAAELVTLRPEDHGHRVDLARLIDGRASRAPDASTAAAIRGEALPHRQAAVRLRPADTADLRALAEACDASGHSRWSALPRNLLALVGAGDPPPPLRRGLPPPLTATARKNHLAGAAWRSPAGLLLNALHAWIARPLDELMRAARGEAGRPAAEVNPALAAEADRIAATLGLAFSMIRIDPESDAPMDLAGLAPPIPVIGRPILEIKDAATRRFALARGFELTRGCAAHAAYVPAGEARALFAGAVALARPDDGPEFALRVDAAPDRVGWWAELLHGLLDDRRLDALARFAGPVAAGSVDAFARWAEGTRRAADRVGLWVSGDLAASIGWLWSRDPALIDHRPASPRALRTLIDASPRIAALHRAAFGDGVFALLAAEDDGLPEAEPLSVGGGASSAGLPAGIEGPSLDEVAEELAAAAARGETVDRPAALERLDADADPGEDTLDGLDGPPDGPLATPDGWDTPPADPQPAIEQAGPQVGADSVDQGDAQGGADSVEDGREASRQGSADMSGGDLSASAPGAQSTPAPAVEPPVEGSDDAAPAAPVAPAASERPVPARSAMQSEAADRLGEALRADTGPFADLGAAAEAGPAVELGGDPRPTARLVGAAEPGPAQDLPGLDHLFDDLDGMDGDGDPTDAIERAALALSDDVGPDGSVVDDGVVDDAAADDSVSDVAADGSAADDSAADDSAADGSAADGSAADDSAADDSAADDSAADDSAADDSAADAAPEDSAADDAADAPSVDLATDDPSRDAEPADGSAPAARDGLDPDAPLPEAGPVLMPPVDAAPPRATRPAGSAGWPVRSIRDPRPMPEGLNALLAPAAADERIQTALDAAPVADPSAPGDRPTIDDLRRPVIDDLPRPAVIGALSTAAAATEPTDDDRPDPSMVTAVTRIPSPVAPVERGPADADVAEHTMDDSLVELIESSDGTDEPGGMQ